mmetsp:Transcript_1524/g.4469  ORF Transcript_1524/g.4469 Transcript_1524/m.4469 type:complete len:310 (-) Transcript_1524:342-1271(-)
MALNFSSSARCFSSASWAISSAERALGSGSAAAAACFAAALGGRCSPAPGWSCASMSAWTSSGERASYSTSSWWISLRSTFATAFFSFFRTGSTTFAGFFAASSRFAFSFCSRASAFSSSFLSSSAFFCARASSVSRFFFSNASSSSRRSISFSFASYSTIPSSRRALNSLSDSNHILLVERKASYSALTFFLFSMRSRMAAVLLFAMSLSSLSTARSSLSSATNSLMLATGGANTVAVFEFPTLQTCVSHLSSFSWSFSFPASLAFWIRSRRFSMTLDFSSWEIWPSSSMTPSMSRSCLLFSFRSWLS